MSINSCLHWSVSHWETYSRIQLPYLELLSQMNVLPACFEFFIDLLKQPKLYVLENADISRCNKNDQSVELQEWKAAKLDSDVYRHSHHLPILLIINSISQSSRTVFSVSITKISAIDATLSWISR